MQSAVWSVGTAGRLRAFIPEDRVGSPRGGERMLLQGKTALIVGVANKRSIAWGIAEAFHREGARLAFNYQGERLKENVEGLAAGIPASVVFQCDVTKDAEIDALFANVRSAFGRLDILVHCVAFAKKEDLEGAF